MARVKVLIGGFLLALIGGISYAWGVFVIPMMNEFGWTKFQATLPFTVFMVVFSITMVPGGKLQDVWGPRRVSLCGAVLFPIAYGLSALVQEIRSPWWLVLTYGLLGGCACGLTYACVAPPARKWFPDKPAFAVALAVMGFGLAAVVIAPLKANVLIPRLGIHGTFIVIAAVAGSLAVLASRLTGNPPADWRPPARGAQAIHASAEDVPPRLLLRKGKFWMIWSTFILVVSGGFITLGLIPSYAQHAISLSAKEAAIAISVFAGVNGFGRPLAGLLADRFGATRVMVATFLLQAAVFLAFEFLAVNLSTLLGLTAVLGWGYAVILALFPVLTSQHFGTRHMGVNYGLVFTAFGVGAVAPLIGAAIFDSTGSFAPIFLPAGLLSAAGASMLLVMRKKYSMA
jgi:OFA family oxalate/formate antiporter-like MFS transporter